MKKKILIMLMLSCIALAACEKEEFYSQESAQTRSEESIEDSCSVNIVIEGDEWEGTTIIGF